MPIGEKLPLMHTLRARQRVAVGISWDIRAGKGGGDPFFDSDQEHELDIACFMYNTQGEFVDSVSSAIKDSKDKTGSIGHSKDDATARGNGDHEFISCQLAGLPEDIAQLMFVVQIRSDHKFADIGNPMMHVVDNMMNNDLGELRISYSMGKDTSACIMARIFRYPESPTGWGLQIIDEYPPIDQVPDWGPYLTRYL